MYKLVDKIISVVCTMDQSCVLAHQLDLFILYYTISKFKKRPSKKAWK